MIRVQQERMMKKGHLTQTKDESDLPQQSSIVKNASDVFQFVGQT